MRVLLDTHTLLWANFSPESLSRQAAKIMADPLNEVFVSAATAWEIATKVRIGKLPGVDKLERNFLEPMEHSGYSCCRSMPRAPSALGGLLHIMAILSIA